MNFILRLRFTITVAAVATAIVARPCAAWDPVAACPKLPKDSLKAQMEAGRLFDEAEKHYSAGHAADALKSFLCSFQIVQHENTVFNIAQIAKLSQDRDVYLSLLKDFVAKTNGRVKVDPIKEIIAELDASDTVGPEADTVVQEDLPQKMETLTVEDAVDATVTEPQKDKRNVLKIVGWTLFATGVATAAAGGALQGLAAGAQQDATRADTLAKFDDAESKMHGLQIGAAAAFAGGGVLMGTGLVLAIIGNRRGESAPVSFRPGPGGIWIAGRF